VSRPLPLSHAAYMIGQVAEGLAYLQEGIEGRGQRFDIVHRDISPMNLVVSHAGQTKIIDFGIARAGHGVKEESGARPGKLSYMSPEQVKGQPLDGRSDIFSLGTILYEVTVGRRLWRGPAEVVMRRIVEEKPPPPTYVKRDFPPALELVILRALEKRPEDRYSGAAEMAEDLELYLVRSAERVGNRQIAGFMREVFASGAAVSERGARRARAFQDDDGEVVDEDSDELDFDRPRAAAKPGAALARALRGSSALGLTVDEAPSASGLPTLPATTPTAPVPALAVGLPAFPVAVAAPAVAPAAVFPPASSAPPRRGGRPGSNARLLAVLLVLGAAAAGLAFLLVNR
jgi:hypothetical protein